MKELLEKRQAELKQAREQINVHKNQLQRWGEQELLLMGMIKQLEELIKNEKMKKGYKEPKK